MVTTDFHCATQIVDNMDDILLFFEWSKIKSTKLLLPRSVLIVQKNIVLQKSIHLYALARSKCVSVIRAFVYVHAFEYTM